MRSGSSDARGPGVIESFVRRFVAIDESLQDRLLQRSFGGSIIHTHDVFDLNVLGHVRLFQSTSKANACPGCLQFCRTAFQGVKQRLDVSPTINTQKRNNPQRKNQVRTDSTRLRASTKNDAWSATDIGRSSNLSLVLELMGA